MKSSELLSKLIEVPRTCRTRLYVCVEWALLLGLPVRRTIVVASINEWQGWLNRLYNLRRDSFPLGVPTR